MSPIVVRFLSILSKKSITLYETESGYISLTFNLGTSLILMKRIINMILSLFNVDFDIDVFLQMYCRLGTTMRLPIPNLYLPYVVIKQESTYTGEMMNVRGTVQVITPDTLQCSLDIESIKLLFPSQKGGGGKDIRHTITKDDLIESIVEATTFKLKKKNENNQSKGWETKLTQLVDTMIQTYPLDNADNDDDADNDNDADNDDNADNDDSTVSTQNKDISKQLEDLMGEISQIKRQMVEISNKL